MKKITVFDFDGTLTLKDSMMAIIVYQRGYPGLVWALLREIHLIILMFLGFYSNQKAKENLLGYCFGGMADSEFDAFCKEFAAKHTSILSPEMTKRLMKAKEEGQQVYVITASPESWVAPLVPDCEVVGSRMDSADGKITGRLCCKNCYGPEKVERLMGVVPELRECRSDYYVTAYGDSKGDREMLAFADEAYMVRKGVAERLKK